MWDTSTHLTGTPEGEAREKMSEEIMTENLPYLFLKTK